MIELGYRYLELYILFKNQAKKNSKVQPWNPELSMFLKNFSELSIFFFKGRIEFQKWIEKRTVESEEL